MKTIDLSASNPTLSEVLDLAGSDNIVLRTTDGREFVLAEVDDFDQEVALVRKNSELMEFLAQRSKEGKRYSLDEVKARLGNG